jgi:hypothetical protein
VACAPAVGISKTDDDDDDDDYGDDDDDDCGGGDGGGGDDKCKELLLELYLGHLQYQVDSAKPVYFKTSP